MRIQIIKLAGLIMGREIILLCHQTGYIDCDAAVNVRNVTLLFFIIVAPRVFNTIKQGSMRFFLAIAARLKWFIEHACKMSVA